MNFLAVKIKPLVHVSFNCLECLHVLIKSRSMVTFNLAESSVTAIFFFKTHSKFLIFNSILQSVWNFIELMKFPEAPLTLPDQRHSSPHIKYIGDHQFKFPRNL